MSFLVFGGRVFQLKGMAVQRPRGRCPLDVFQVKQGSLCGCSRMTVRAEGKVAYYGRFWFLNRLKTGAK